MKKPARRKPKRKVVAPVVRPTPSARAKPHHGMAAVSAIVLQRWFTDDGDPRAMIVLMMPVVLLALSVSTMQIGRGAAVNSDAVFDRLVMEQPLLEASGLRPVSPAEPVGMRIDPPATLTLPGATSLEIIQELANASAPADAPPLDPQLLGERLVTASLPSSEVVLVLDHLAADDAVGARNDALPQSTELAMLAPEFASSMEGAAIALGSYAHLSDEFASGAEDDQAIARPPVVIETEIAALDAGLAVGPARADNADDADEFETEPSGLASALYADDAVCRPAAPASAFSSPYDPAMGDFGVRLAAAALAQTQEYVVYNAKYKHIRFPMGDLHPLHGACSDVIVRAYRTLGIDLQRLVQMARLGHDPNIDHRRTETLRRLFARFGQSIPVSTFPEEYQPGDIVTYYRPFSRVSRAHIAIVADILAPSGRPMIIHNRGWGPQLEDALFSDRITGHYRFAGISPGIGAANMTSANSANSRNKDGQSKRRPLPATGQSLDQTPGQTSRQSLRQRDGNQQVSAHIKSERAPGL